MKAILICKNHNFSKERFEEIARPVSIDGYEILALNSFLFDLSVASHLLANIQSWLNDQEKTYHVIYLQDEPVVFHHPDKSVSILEAM